VRLDLRRGLNDLHRDLADFQKKQIPFATALGLTSLAKAVQADEAIGIKSTFKSPTPFTQNAFAIIPATKSSLIASVFSKDAQSQYLEPFVDGGTHFLGAKKGLLVPKSINLNQYGNLARNKLASLKADPTIFIGPVKTKSGIINGVWQRQTVKQVARRRKAAGMAKQDNPKGGLKLLIRFEDPLPVNEHLDFYGRGQRFIEANAEAILGAALEQALTTARPS
jgi:hypothetical protein